MPPTLQELGIDRLSPEDRLVLIEQIWDSLSGTDLSEIPQSHRDELDRRIVEADANPSAGSSWHEARARLRGGQ